MGNPACVQCQPSGVLHRGLRARQEIAFFDPNTGIGAVIACMSGNTSFDFQVFSREWSKREIIPTNEHCCGLNDCSQLRNKCVLSRIGLFSLTRSPSLFFDATSTSLFSLSLAPAHPVFVAWCIVHGTFSKLRTALCALVPTPDCIEFAIVQWVAAAGNWALLPLLLERLAGAPQCDATPADEESQTSGPPLTAASPPTCCDEAPPPPPPRSQKDPLFRQLHTMGDPSQVPVPWNCQIRKHDWQAKEQGQG